MNLTDGSISNRQWFRMSFLECVTVSMMVIPYITLSLAGIYHVYALLIGLLMIILYGSFIFMFAKAFPFGYVNTIRNYMGWMANLLDILYAIRFVVRAVLLSVFFSMIIKRCLLQSFSVWGICLPFFVIAIYGASTTMEGRGRMFELLFGWMVVPLILIVCFSISGMDIQSVLKEYPVPSNKVGIIKGAYAVLLSMSPLELQLFSLPCVRKEQKMEPVRLLLWILFTILFAYYFIVSILGYAWTQSSPVAGFSVMEAASFPGGAVARLDYLMMAFWTIGVFAVVSGYLHQAKNVLYSLCSVRNPHGKWLTFFVLFLCATGVAFAMQIKTVVVYGMRYFLFADMAISILLPAVVLWVKMKKHVRWGSVCVCAVLLATVVCVIFGKESFGTTFLSSGFAAEEKKQESMEYRDYVNTLQVSETADGYRFCFLIADISGYKNDASVDENRYEIYAQNLQEAKQKYEVETERQLDFGHIGQIETTDMKEGFHRLLLELSDWPEISKSVDVKVGDKKYILREMIKAAYGRESL